MGSLSVLAVDEQSPDLVLWSTIGIGALLWAGLIVFCYKTRAGIVARATTKEAVRQPVFFLMLLIALALLVLNTFLPFFTLGGDVKMLKDCGLVTILAASLLLAVWTASTGISAEIEGKTTMTLLSKPLNRRQFVIGKFLGIVQALMILLVPLAISFLALIYFKVGYDARESSQTVPDAVEWVTPSWEAFGNEYELAFEVPQPTKERWDSAIKTVPGLVMIFFEAVVLTAISVAIATRAPMVVNIVTCLTIYVIGNLVPVLVQVSTQNKLLETVQFVSRLIATILPALAMFDMKTAVATDQWVPPSYIGLAAVYCVVYSAAAILLAFLLFEDRDLA